MKHYNITEIAILAGLSESAVRAAIRRGELSEAKFRHNGRAVWGADIVAEFLETLRSPRPLEDRRIRAFEIAETR